MIIDYWKNPDERLTTILENRWQTIGKVDSVIFVAYEERVGDEIRLISARLATAAERRIYNGYSNNEDEPWGPAY